MARRKLRYTWSEAVSGYYLIDTKTGKTAWLSDGVDMFIRESGRSISPGTAAFDRAMNHFVRTSQAEIKEAYRFV